MITACAGVRGNPIKLTGLLWLNAVITASVLYLGLKICPKARNTSLSNLWFTITPIRSAFIKRPTDQFLED